MTNQRFTSPLAADLEAFLAYRKQVRRQYLSPPAPLYRFDRFVAEHCRRGPVKLEEIVLRWLARPGERAPLTLQGDLAYVRQFCLFLRRRDPAAYIPSTDLVPPYRHLFKPHIYSPDEVRRLLREARAAKDSDGCRGYRAITLETFLLVLYCTGLRPGEAERLSVEDVDIEERAFFIRESKGKSRWVPFDHGLAKQLARYLEYRWRVAAPGESRFFLRPTGRPYGRTGFQCWFRRALRRAGITPGGRRRPRLYDFRHTFAVERLTRWYRQRVNFSDRLPWLSTYMGHRDLMGTEVYLQATPELLELASRRFARRFRRSETP